MKDVSEKAEQGQAAPWDRQHAGQKKKDLQNAGELLAASPRLYPTVAQTGLRPSSAVSFCL